MQQPVSIHSFGNYYVFKYNFLKFYTTVTAVYFVEICTVDVK